MTTSSPSLPPHRTVRVDLGPRSYDVLIGRGLGGSIGCIIRSEALRLIGQPVIIVDGNAPMKFWQEIQKSLNVEIDNVLLMPGGERSKSLSGTALLKEWNLCATKLIDDLKTAVAAKQPNTEIAKLITKHTETFFELTHRTDNFKSYGNLLSDLANLRISRSGIIIGVGGGVIGDLAGFVAATYLRGVAFVQVPTTLLAMVDSSVGGKTGVNLPEGKNLVGAFHQPKLVVADLDTLSTLPAREFAAGMAEVIKYGAIKDKALFDRVAKGVKPDDADLDEIVEKCVAIKARIVENDEFETKGERALLNFGHTIGHAIEKATGYNTYLHGEAISLGMRAAAWLSVWQAGLPEADARRIESALDANGLPLTLKATDDRAAILAALGNDKKVAADGKNRWVLLRSLGVAECGFTLSPELVARGIELLRGIPQ